MLLSNVEIYNLIHSFRYNMERSTPAPELHPHTIMDPPSNNIDYPLHLAVSCKFLIFEILVLCFHPRHLSEESNKQNLHLSVNSTCFPNSDGFANIQLCKLNLFFWFTLLNHGIFLLKHSFKSALCNIHQLYRCWLSFLLIILLQIEVQVRNMRIFMQSSYNVSLFTYCQSSWPSCSWWIKYS